MSPITANGLTPAKLPSTIEEFLLAHGLLLFSVAEHTLAHTLEWR